jgi:hypothetical protein
MSFKLDAMIEVMDIVAGLNPISIVTELRLQHAQGNKYAGVNVRKVRLIFARFCDTLARMVNPEHFSTFCSGNNQQYAG